MSSAETSIKQTATEISTRLSQTSIESLINNKATVITDNKIKETSDSFSREITRVENKADSLTVKVNTVKDTVDSHTQLIGQQGSSLTATIQKVDSIQSSVSNIDGRLSTVTQTADGLVTTVQNLSVGGSNLLLNADFEITDNKTSFVVGGVTYSQGPRYWSTYNGGIPNATTSYHSYSGSFGGRNNVVIFNESDGSRNWKAITQSIGKTIMPDFPDTTNDFMLSFDAYANLAGTKLFGGFYYVNKLTGATNFHAGQFTINSITAGAWNRYSVKVPFNKDICDFSKTFSFLIYGFGFSSNAILAIDNVQLETGTISSAFGKAKKELDDKIASIQTTVTQTANSWSVKNLTSGGSILGQINLTDGTVKIDGKYVKITGQTLIDNGIITNAMIKDLTADKIVGGTIDASKISVINLNASNITSGQISGGLIKGGVLTALNGAMSIDLNKGQMEMYNDNPAIRRVVAGLPNQFIKFSTGTQPNDNNYRIIGSGTKSNLTAAITSIGTNRLRTENNLDGGFTGINIYAGGSGTGDSIVDRIEISSDILKIAHSANSSDRGWVFENINGINNQYVFRPNTTYQDTYKAMIGTSLNPIDEIYINEMYIKGQRLGYILKDIANRIGNVGAWASAIS
ncbi:gp58-like family protein [Streptococcus pseudoporcinus]|nr:gp58-like family protein [Streptococcus pseudoporcinus]VTS32088.1 prophage LambdaSa1, N-acetylmuramoyl-L-alanine amidase, family 4 [Streptococcus pseudoporcinus]